MKTADLTGALLALWVARAQGRDVRANAYGYWVVRASAGLPFEGYIGEESGALAPKFSPHEDWAQGGPIIEREHICTAHFDNFLDDRKPVKWRAGYVDGEGYFSSLDLGFASPTLLVAAMRAYVASKYGDTVPDEAT